MKRFTLLTVLSIFVISCQTEPLEDLTNNDNLNVANATYYESSTMYYYGDHLWYGNFAGITAWFEGASPQQISNGTLSSFEVKNPPNGYSSYASQGVSSYGGSRNGFYFGKIMLHNTSVTIPMEKLTRQEDGTWEFESVTRTISSYGGSTGNFTGKIILDQNCLPRIVTSDSDMPAGCMYADGKPILIPY